MGGAPGRYREIPREMQGDTKEISTEISTEIWRRIWSDTGEIQERRDLGRVREVPTVISPPSPYSCIHLPISRYISEI
jgi:hypothetical protein